MIKKLLALDGVLVVAHFRDDGEFLEGYGMLNEEMMRGLAHFAHGYKRICQGNADQLSMFTQISAWTPPRGWMVRGQGMTVCSFGNLVCLVENAQHNLAEIMKEMEEVAHS